MERYSDTCTHTSTSDLSSRYVQTNPDYKSTYVFKNDFAALLPDAPEPRKATKLPLIVLFQSH